MYQRPSSRNEAGCTLDYVSDPKVEDVLLHGFGVKHPIE